MTGACEAVSPFRKNLRESLTRRVMMFAIGTPFLRRALDRFYQGNQNLFEVETGVLELRQSFADSTVVGRGFVPAFEVTKNLLDHACLALHGTRQNLTQLP